MMSYKLEDFFAEVKNYVYIIALEDIYSMSTNSFVITSHDKDSVFSKQQEPDVICFPKKAYSKTTFEMFYHIMDMSVKRLYKYYIFLGAEEFKKIYSKSVAYIVNELIDERKVDDLTIEKIEGSRRGLLLMFRKIENS